MQVNRIIIHNLQKELNEKASLFISANSINPKDEKVISIVAKLNSKFNANYHHGIFSIEASDADTFQKDFDIYLKKKSPAIQERFLTFTKNAVSHLYQRIDSLATAKGGYIVFIDYTTPQLRHYFSVFLIRDVTDNTFEIDKKSITIKEVTHADTTHLAMACRIDISKYNDNTEENYLHFLSVKHLDASQYFLKWIGAERKIRNKENSIVLLSIFSKIDPPNDENGNPISRDLLNRKVYDYINSIKPKEININTLSSYIFDDESIISTYAEQNDFELASDFHPVNNVIKRLVFNYVEAEEIKISYPRRYYKNKIKIDEKSPDTVIIKSKSLADSIRKAESQ
jgi:nucleoid-associated protein YejK